MSNGEPRVNFASLSESVLSSLRVIEWVARWLISVILFFIFLLAVAAWLTLGPDYFASGVRAFSVAALVALASASVGGLLGFLFGIPKLLQRPAGNPPSKEENSGGGEAKSGTNAGSRSVRFFMSNTSFEEVSDWLTKIIIGLGLVQFQAILNAIHTASIYAGAYVTQTSATLTTDCSLTCPDARVAVAFMFALIVASLFSSCLFIYLETRTRLTLIFLGMEIASDTVSPVGFEESLARNLSVRSDNLNETILGPVSERGTVSLARPSAEDEKIASVPREQLHSAVDIAGWASAQARAGHFQAAEDAFRDALQREPTNVDVLMRLAELRRLRLNVSGFADAVFEAATKSLGRPDIDDALLRVQLESLYLPSPEGFEKSLEAASLLARSPYSNQPFVALRRAAALGQKYRYFKGRGGGDMDAIRKEALAAVEQVIELAPDPKEPARVYLARIFDPSGQNGNAEENDLEVFRDMPEFEELILGSR